LYDNIDKMGTELMALKGCDKLDKINETGYLPFETLGDPKTLNCDRDSQGDVWFSDMGVSIIRPKNLDNLAHGVLPQQWVRQKIYPIKSTAGLNVNFAWQISQATEWLRLNSSKNKNAAKKN
jgi:hypothetical protein